jgi:hypothetical protein
MTEEKRARAPPYDKKVGLVLQGGRAPGQPDLTNTDQASRLYEHGCLTEMDIVQLAYRGFTAMAPQKTMSSAVHQRRCCGVHHDGLLRCPGVGACVCSIFVSRFHWKP